ncbi:hypothetical protein OCU04_004979 [Sclerotinia nivalis]|uniref:Uncharacterized protein n=1 Tax=Sclerotinia nivalis TaxID=352851 RepID=A0A9X0AN71_9HELO|nr:hypothetical protein OCU04_004979 [Sclerotinia nivalis]
MYYFTASGILAIPLLALPNQVLIVTETEVQLDPDVIFSISSNNIPDLSPELDIMWLALQRYLIYAAFPSLCTGEAIRKQFVYILKSGLSISTVAFTEKELYTT